MPIAIPPDFPVEQPVAALTGAQPKIAVRYDAHSGSYTTALPDAELLARYEMCEDLARQLEQKCRKNRDTKYSQMSESEILISLLSKLLQAGWGSNAEMRWVIRRTAEILGWPTPAAANA